MISKLEGERIALDVHAARPEWTVAGILAALGRCRDKGDAFTIRRAALRAAHNPANSHPGSIAEDGAHWTPPDTGKRAKCPTHELAQPCRSCRADALAAGTETTTRTRTRTWRTDEDCKPMPAWLRAQLTPKEK